MSQSGRMPPSSSMTGLSSSLKQRENSNNNNSSNGSRPIHISRNASSRGGGGNLNDSDFPVLAQSCPTFTIAAPKAPAARPRLPSLEPPSLALPPSPPVYAPVPELLNKKTKEHTPSSRASGQVYSRSLSNYHNDFLSLSAPSGGGEFLLSHQWNPSFGQIAEVDDTDSESNTSRVGGGGSAFNSTAHSTDVEQEQDGDDDDLSEDSRLGRKLSSSGGEFSDQSANNNNNNNNPALLLSKSPTVFSILTGGPDGYTPPGSSRASVFGSINNLPQTSNQMPSPGLFPSSSSSPSSSSPSSASSSSSSSHKMSSRASGVSSVNKIPGVTSSKRGTSKSSARAARDDAFGGDDLQFSISLTDDSILDEDEEQENSSNSLQQNMEFLPLY